MAVKIRLRQQGRKNHQTYRIVVTDVRNKRDGKYLEKVGSYDPLIEKDNVKVNEERVLYWLDRGAEISIDAEKLIFKSAPNVMQQLNEKREAKRIKICAKRRTLRRAKKKAKEKAAV